MMPPNIADIIKYNEIVILFEKIKNSKALQQKEIYLRKYIEEFHNTKKKLGINSTTNSDSTFYSVLRILLPNIDNRNYGIKTTTMGRIYVNVLGLAQDGEDAKNLTYKNENQSYQGDFAEIVYNDLKSRSNTGCNYSLKQFHELLDKIANSDRKIVEMELTKFFEVATALEQKWFIRIVLKKLHLGIGEQKIFSVYDSRARPLFMKLTNLLKVCEIIESGQPFDIDNVELQVFQHIKAMLCQKVQTTKFEQIFRGNTFYFVETKMDGERFQLHMSDGKFKYFSRNGIDYTKGFGEKLNEGNLTPTLSKCLCSSVNNVILDGEMMVWSKSKKEFCIKGENYDVKHLSLNEDLNPCFVVFDILYLNNVSYLEQPFIERRKKLYEILKFKAGIIQLCKKNLVHNLEEFVDKFNEAMNSNEEGIVLKHPMSSYKPGIRGGGWYKLKPDYVNDVIADLCFIIMGVIYDRSKNFINSYLLGALTKNEDNTSTPKIQSVANVNSGLSNAERERLNNLIKPYLIENKPDNFETGKLLADLWLPLNNAVLLDVTAAELNKSDDFKTDFTLRFPRILSIRNDKIWLESTTIEDLHGETVENERVKKIYKRNINLKDFEPAKKMKILAENPYKSEFQLDDIPRLTSLFENREFCILSGSADGKYTIENLKRIVLQHGGKVVENPTIHKNCICIAGKIGFRAKKKYETQKYNIIKIDWLVDNYLNKTPEKFYRPKPRDIIYATEELESKQKKYFDKYGDSYTDLIEEKELQRLFDEIKNPPILSNSEIHILKLELDRHLHKYSNRI